MGNEVCFDVFLTMSWRLDCIINWISIKAPLVEGTLRIMDRISEMSTIRDAPRAYRVYIVRCWEEQVSDLHEVVMRFSLDIPTTGERCGFTEQDELLDALRAELSNARDMGRCANGSA